LTHEIEGALTYAETRDAETLRLLNKPMNEFIKELPQARAPAMPCQDSVLLSSWNGQPADTAPQEV
jgi:hypothetical protein